MRDKERIIFICTHNSARSQMAEALLRALCGDRYEAYSAGTEPSSVDPHAIRVMREIGIDISSHQSKGLGEFADMTFDYVVTVCDHAKQICPVFPQGKELLHRGFTDPTACQGEEEERLAMFRHARNEIKQWIGETFCEGGGSAKGV